MDRMSYMERLAWLLGDLPEEERNEALRYYEDYFEEAGPEREEEVISELGSPEQVACVIRMNQKEPGDFGEYTEQGYRDTRFEERRNQVGHYTEMEKADKIYQENASRADSGEGGRTEESAGGRSTGMTALLIILAVFSFPVWGGLLIGVIGVLIGLVCCILALGIGLVAGTFGCLAGGIAALAVGAVRTFMAPGAGLLLVGSGFLAMAFGLGGILLCRLVFGSLLPLCFQGIGNLFRFIFRRNRRRGAGV